MTRTRKRSATSWWRVAFLAPAIALYGLFVLWPLIQTAQFSFYEWDGVTAATPVGLANYADAIGDREVRLALLRSFVFVAFYCVLPTIIGLVMAGIMARVRVRGLTFFRAVLFMPQVLSMVVVAVAWRWMYAEQGPINAAVDAAGGTPNAFLGDFTLALPAVGLIGTWVMFGLCMVLFIAGVQKIPAELYEAARLDGAGPIREFFTVTLPALRGEIMVALVFTLTIALRNFDIVWNTTRGGPGTTTTVPSLFIYDGAFVSRQVGDAAAISVLLTVLILGLTAVIIRALRDREA
ncbi:carbohydrate ABC transporter permease [Aeromicrobium sp. CTD01-1L150]|uniref:carbohydrate ABC transporter permease n=1 Tax=Aeromicrobium sp. CTD01-1L150 TaxID=3341830 RepID=UPI0035C189D9